MTQAFLCRQTGGRVSNIQLRNVADAIVIE